MAKKGIIVECQDNKSWHCPIHCVPKKNGKLRIVANYRPTLNKLTSEENYRVEILKIDLIMFKIEPQNKFLTCLDVASGYKMLPTKKADRYKTFF
jgi:hypothetical protein